MLCIKNSFSSSWKKDLVSYEKTNLQKAKYKTICIVLFARHLF
jgi:hypothetical protein